MADPSLLERIRGHMHGIPVASHHDRVYKEECMFSFDTPLSPGGLFINLKSFQAFSEEYVAYDHQRTNNYLYLHEKWTKVPLSEAELAERAKPEKMAIGVAGGFAPNAPNYHIEKAYAIVLMPDRAAVPLPCPDLPEVIIRAAEAIIDHDSATFQDSVAVWEVERRVSKYAENLVQLDTGRRISPNPRDWKCDESGAAENLWLNLSTGFIGSGRQNWDNTGGTGSALRHFEATGRLYPLVVKLGTITPHGADVYSYAPDEDDMVIDPYLDKHLAHWGINMMQMAKTEKTMTELEIDLNANFELSAITEAGGILKPLAGPGLVGLTNLGNTCYMNSVMQLVFTVDELCQRYVNNAQSIFATAPVDITLDLPTQIAKLGLALVHGRGLPPPSNNDVEGEAEGAFVPLTVKPASLKGVVGRNHPEFSSARQQDAGEFYQHLLDLVGRTEHANGQRLPSSSPATPAYFTFSLEDRVQCLESGRVRYMTSSGNLLGLDIPLEAATNKAEVEEYKNRQVKRARLKESSAAAYITQDGSLAGEGPSSADIISRDEPDEPVTPKVPFECCLAKWAADELMTDYFSAALGRKTSATKRTRFASFPPYLILQMKRYYVDRDWVPKKMDVLVEVPELLNLDSLRGRGPQPGEELQPEDSGSANEGASAASAPPPINQEVFDSLSAMGFSENGVLRAMRATGGNNAEAAAEWVFAHMGDDDFNDPLPSEPGRASSKASGPEPDPEQVSMLASMGFNESAARAALRATHNSIERAADWLFSHMADLDAAVAEVEGAAAPAAAAASTPAAPNPQAAGLDGPGVYELVGFVSHMGANTSCGHYVCHIKKGGRWVIYNDEKVAESEKPPKDRGYIYLYKRASQ